MSLLYSIESTTAEWVGRVTGRRFIKVELTIHEVDQVTAAKCEMKSTTREMF